MKAVMKFNIFKNISLSKVLTAAAVIAIVYAVTISSLTYFRASKIGYMNTQSLLEKHPAAVKAKAEMDKKSTEWRNNIQTLEAELSKLNKEMLENGSRWSKQELLQKESVMKQKQADYNRYRRAIEEKANQTEAELMKPVFSEINAKIESFGKDKGYDIILGTLSGGNILYAAKAKDLTDEFLEYAKKK